MVTNPHYNVLSKGTVQRKTEKTASKQSVQPLVVQNPFFKSKIQIAHK